MSDEISKRLAAAIKATNDAAKALEALRLQLDDRGFVERVIHPAPRDECDALPGDRECHFCGRFSPSAMRITGRHWCGYCEKPGYDTHLHRAARIAEDRIAYAMDRAHEMRKDG